MTRQPRTFPDPKPYSRRIYDAIYEQEVAQPGVPLEVVIPSPKDADEREQLAAFLVKYRAAAAKGEMFEYVFRLDDQPLE